MLEALEYALTRLIIPIAMAFGSGYLIYIGGGLLREDNSLAATACFFGSALLLFFVYLSRMKIIQGFGIKLETWEEKQKEAVDLIAKMREMAATFGKVASSELMTGMFVRRELTTKQRVQFHEEIVRQLKKLHVPASNSAEIKAERRRIASVLYFNHISKAAQDEDKAGRHVQIRIESDANECHVVPTANFITEVLKRENQLHPETKLWIDDYEHFCRTEEIRRIDKFMKD